MSWPTEPSSVPPNGPLTSATTGEMLRPTLPSALSSSSTAEPWKPLGHPSCVYHLGCALVAPLAVVRLRLSVGGGLTARAGAAVSAAAPTVTPISPARTAARCRPVPVRHLSLASRRQPRRRTIPPTHRYGSHHMP